MKAISNIEDLHIGVIGLSEINTNMNIDANFAGIRRSIQSRWKNMKMIGGSCSGESIESHLQGGTLLAASAGYETRVRESKPDLQHMGYFSYMEMEGKGESQITDHIMLPTLQGIHKGWRRHYLETSMGSCPAPRSWGRI